MLVEDEAGDNNTRRRTSLIRPQLLLVRVAKGCHQVIEWFRLEELFSSWSEVPIVVFKEYDWNGEKASCVKVVVLYNFKDVWLNA